MITKVKILIVLLAALLLLTGCSLLSLDQLYYPPKRSGDQDDLQVLIDEAMKNLSYSAPISGKNLQAVQTADLDGDGSEEYLLFAKDDSDDSLKILIFSQVASGYVLMDTIEGYGFAFDFVEFAQVDDRDGMEIIVGRRVSEEVPRSVSVYRFTSDFARQLLSTSYSNISICDLDEDGITELLIFGAGAAEQGKGVAVYYGYSDGEMHRIHVSYLSQTIDHLQQVELGILEDGTPAVFATSAEKGNSISVDVFAICNDALQNLSNGVTIPAIRNYQAYPADIDDDGVLELPRLVSVPTVSPTGMNEYVLSWYSLDRNGQPHEKTYTYHHYPDGWYLFLDAQLVNMLAVEQLEDACVFYYQDAQSGELHPILTVHTLTGSDRETQAMLPGRMVLYKGDSIIYVAELADQEGIYGITAESLLEDFRPIRQEWNQEESGD